MNVESIKLSISKEASKLIESDIKKCRSQAEYVGLKLGEMSHAVEHTYLWHLYHLWDSRFRGNKELPTEYKNAFVSGLVITGNALVRQSIIDGRVSGVKHYPYIEYQNFDKYRLSFSEDKDFLDLISNVASSTFKTDEEIEHFGVGCTEAARFYDMNPFLHTHIR